MHLFLEVLQHDVILLSEHMFYLVYRPENANLLKLILFFMRDFEAQQMLVMYSNGSPCNYPYKAQR